MNTNSGLYLRISNSFLRDIASFGLDWNTLTFAKDGFVFGWVVLFLCVLLLFVIGLEKENDNDIIGGSLGSLKKLIGACHVMLSLTTTKRGVSSFPVVIISAQSIMILQLQGSSPAKQI